MFQSEKKQIEDEVRRVLAANGLTEGEMIWKYIPFKGSLGVSGSPVNIVAANAKKKGLSIDINKETERIVQSLSKQFSFTDDIERIESEKIYWNWIYNKKNAKKIVDTVLREKTDYGKGELKHQRVMVEFSQPNTHKAFHVGHLRNVILGNAVCNILEKAGNEVIRANYLGDIGLHVIKWMWCYLKYHNGEVPTGDITRWMGDLYTEASRRHEDEPDAEGEIRALFARWDRRDPEVTELWKRTRQWSLDGFEDIYRTLNVKFDHLYFESEVEDSGKEIVDELVSKGIAVDERPENAVAVKLDELCGTKEKYRVLVVLRSDGTSLYATKDLSLAIKKFAQFKLDRSIYVIDVRQSLYMQQIFKTLELMGYPWTGDCFHLAYEIVNLPGNVTMSSRDGTVVFLQDLIDEATSRALTIVQEKNPDLDSETKLSIANQVALGALKYSMLSRDNTKIVTFDWEAALDFNGQAAPYIQYAGVRANSILRKAGGIVPPSVDLSYELTSVEIELLSKISRFPEEIQRSAAECKPLFVANLAYDIAQAFNNFYRQCPVIQAEPAVRDFRLRIAAASRQAIVNSLALLGIETPEVM
ncbi:MAG: arginine--tRNA ligase [Flexilinea sp.]